MQVNINVMKHYFIQSQSFFVGVKGEQFATFDLIRTTGNNSTNLMLGNILYIMNVISTYCTYQLCPKYIPQNTSFLNAPQVVH